MPSPTILSTNKGIKNKPITLLPSLLIFKNIIINRIVAAGTPNSPIKETIEDSVTRTFSSSQTSCTEYPIDESEPNPRPHG